MEPELEISQFENKTKEIDGAEGMKTVIYLGHECLLHQSAGVF
jgi:hypothetical protein